LPSSARWRARRRPAPSPPSAPNGKSSKAGAINASGAAPIGFVRRSDGTFETFAVPGATLTDPYAINASGVVAGNAWAFIYTP
jgi:hypothetical protein